MELLNILPQLIWIAWVALSFGVNATRHGEERPGKINVWAYLAATAIKGSLLYWGGFFDVFLAR